MEIVAIVEEGKGKDIIKLLEIDKGKITRYTAYCL